MKNRNFVVIVNCQGQPFYYFYRTLLGAFLCYTKQYLKGRKYNWVITLKESVVVTNVEDYEIKRR